MYFYFSFWKMRSTKKSHCLHFNVYRFFIDFRHFCHLCFPLLVWPFLSLGAGICIYPLTFLGPRFYSSWFPLFPSMPLKIPQFPLKSRIFPHLVCVPLWLWYCDETYRPEMCGRVPWCRVRAKRLRVEVICYCPGSQWEGHHEAPLWVKGVSTFRACLS